MSHLDNLSLKELRQLAYAKMRLPIVEKIERCEDSLINFVEGAWPSIDPSAYKKNWAVDGLCEHLEAVTKGQISRLLINMPPRTGKTTVTSICWPAWTWARRQKSFWSGPKVRFLCGSYGQKLSFENSNKTRRLIQSPWYQERWGKRVKIREDQNSKEQFDLVAGGSRTAASVGGSLLGLGGDILEVDDPHNLEEVESDVGLETARNWFAEFRSTRMNDPKLSALVVNMQRLNVEDISGVIAAGEDYDEWVHFMVPMEHDPKRHCVTVLKWDDSGEPEETWEDPRTEENELMWPERVGPKELNSLKRELGPYMASGRLQQSPTPAGGGIIKEDMWRLWPSESYPQCELVMGSLDTASTEKEENDCSALTIWGVFRDGHGSPKAILLYSWEGRLEINDLVILVGTLCSVEKRSNAELERALALFNRGKDQADTLYRVPVDRLLVENKNNGISAAHELIRLFGHSGNFAVELIDPKIFGDKVARIIACEPMFADEMVYAPDRAFAERVINNVAAVPKTSKWDTPDSVSQALLYMRKTGLLLRKDEQARVTHEELLFKPKLPALY